jgi:hypothetical protein
VDVCIYVWNIINTSIIETRQIFWHNLYTKKINKNKKTIFIALIILFFNNVFVTMVILLFGLTRNEYM